MDPARFDNLVRSLTKPASRRGALGVVGGAALALLETSRSDAKRRHRHGNGKGTQAAGGGNSACAHFCAAVFGADTPAAGQCTSDAAHGKGLCYQCGPASNGKQKLCGTTCLPTSGCCTNADCTLPQTCGGGGKPNVCGCIDNGTACQGKNCGSLTNNCGQQVSCGKCTAPNTCGGGGTANQCGCTPDN